MNVLRWSLAVLFFAAFVWMAVIHAGSFIAGFRKKAPSLVPLVGGLCGMLAMLIVPLPSLRKWWWLAFVVDCGSLPLIIRTLIYGVIQSRRG